MPTNTNKENAEDLEKLRGEVERITQKYINTLIESEEARANHADFLMTILESVADGLIVYDCDEKVLLVNQAAARMSGTDLSGSDKPAIRRQFSLYHSKDGKLMPHSEEPYHHAIKTKTSCEKEAYIAGDTIEDGGLWIRAHAAPVLDKKENLLGVVTTFHDITERRRLQHQRDALASVIAHDLKNHLAGEDMILTYLTNDSTGIQGTALDALQKMQASNKHHLELATSLLEIYRTDFVISADSTVDLDIKRIIDVGIFINSLSAAAIGVEFEVEIEDNLPQIKGVPAAIRHALHNLLQNAVKMSKKGDKIKVSVVKKNGSIAISVADKGQGMSEDEVSHLFDPTNIAKKLPSNIRSSGVGLFLSKLLLDAHRASLSCTSKAGSGTTFTIELPV